jgi:hypothetical protein
MHLKGPFTLPKFGTKTVKVIVVELIVVSISLGYLRVLKTIIMSRNRHVNI